MSSIEATSRKFPDSVEITRNRLNLMSYSRTHSAADIFNQTMVFWRVSDLHSAPQKAHVHIKNRTDANKEQIRIGYVSADFGIHSNGILFGPVLNAHNTGNFHTILYSNNTHEDDDVTKEMKAACGDWRSIAYWSDDQVVRQILDDKIDILVDLSGHTGGHRLDVFRRKPAPVQMTWLGYFTTTGLKEIDYILADRHVLPEGEEGHYTETPLRLPNTYFCFQPPTEDLPVQPPPFLKRSGLTFGCLNNILKLNADVIGAWSEILESVTGSRLMIKSPQLSHDSNAKAVERLFKGNEISPERLIILGETRRKEHMAIYNAIDIALDPFPFGGGTTTVEALWMGVPVISLAGDRWVSRVGASILFTVGLSDMVAKSRSEYIDMAVKLANDPNGIIALRRNMRMILESSAMTDSDRFTGAIEKIYREIWQSWCVG